MKRDELIAAYVRLRDFIGRTHYTGEKERQALADLRLLGRFVGMELETRGPEMDKPEQPALLDVPVKRRAY